MLRKRERKDQGIRQLGVSSSSVATFFFLPQGKATESGTGRVGTGHATSPLEVPSLGRFVHFWGKLFGLHRTPKKVINENITGSNMDMR